MHKAKIGLSWIALVGVAITAACTGQPSPSAPSPSEPTSLATEEVATEPPDDITFTSCPEQDWNFRLDYTHKSVLNPTDAILIEILSKPGASFMFTIYEDGTIDGDNFDNRVPITITGKVEDCVFEGENMLHADIFGLCVDGIATVDITESYTEGFTFLETCPEGSMVQGADRLVSAPEVQYDFDLKKGSETKKIEMDAGFLSIRYTWTLHEAGLGVLPLPTLNPD
jgi:hypothetical protein